MCSSSQCHWDRCAGSMCSSSQCHWDRYAGSMGSSSQCHWDRYAGSMGSSSQCHWDRYAGCARAHNVTGIVVWVTGSRCSFGMMWDLEWCVIIQWRIYIVKFLTRAPPPLNFHALFRKIWLNNRLVPLWEILDSPLTFILTKWKW